MRVYPRPDGMKFGVGGTGGKRRGVADDSFVGELRGAAPARILGGRCSGVPRMGDVGAKLDPVGERKDHARISPLRAGEGVLRESKVETADRFLVSSIPITSSNSSSRVSSSASGRLGVTFAGDRLVGVRRGAQCAFAEGVSCRDGSPEPKKVESPARMGGESFPKEYGTGFRR